MFNPARKFLLAAALVGAMCLPGYGNVENSPIGGQQFEGKIVVQASPEAVWALLTDLEQFSAIMGFKWLDGKKQVNMVGDTARMEVWSDPCTYLLTYVKPHQELRLALEPDNASYICQKRWLLSPAEGGGTQLHLIDRYTESGSQSAESLKSQVEAWENHLAQIKAAVEK